MTAYGCPGGCGRTTSRPALGCAVCMNQVPRDLRRRLMEAERDRDLDLHLEAERDIVRWLHDHPAPATAVRRG